MIDKKIFTHDFPDKSLLVMLKGFMSNTIIKANHHYGHPISKKLIPQEYKDKYAVKNLFRVELPNFWRMLYTLVDGETKIEIIAFVPDMVDHLTYDKKFGYKKK